MTVSCAYAGLTELGLADTYVKITTKPLATVAAWLTQDDRVFDNILQIINEIDPTMITEETNSPQPADNGT